MPYPFDPSGPSGDAATLGGAVPAGPGQALVTYYSPDTGDDADLSSFTAYVARAAEHAATEGWRMASCSVLPVRQVGTVGNVLFQSGGQRATMFAAVVLYVRG